MLIFQLSDPTGPQLASILCVFLHFSKVLPPFSAKFWSIQDRRSVLTLKKIKFAWLFCMGQGFAMQWWEGAQFGVINRCTWTQYSGDIIHSYGKSHAVSKHAKNALATMETKVPKDVFLLKWACMPLLCPFTCKWLTNKNSKYCHPLHWYMKQKVKLNVSMPAGSQRGQRIVPLDKLVLVFAVI